MGDLVQRLRGRKITADTNPWLRADDLCIEAADRIEALEAELATCRAAMAVMDNTVAELEYENDSLKAIVQGWHWLAVGPDEMGDHYTQKQLIKASEPYASPALKEIGDDRQ